MANQTNSLIARGAQAGENQTKISTISDTHTNLRQSEGLEVCEKLYSTTRTKMDTIGYRQPTQFEVIQIMTATMNRT